MAVLNQTGRGTYWRAHQFARRLSSRGHSVTLMATSPRARARLRTAEVDGYRLVETPDLLPGPLRSGWDAWATFRRIWWLRGQTFDLVHAFESRPVVIYPALAAQRAGARLVLDWCDWFGRGGSVEERPNPLVRGLLRPVETFFETHFRTRAVGTTVINHALRTRAEELGVPAHSILLLRNGSEVHFPLEKPESARHRLGLPPVPALIGFVGGTYLRDAAFMARAFNLVLAELPQARLLLVGYFNREIEDQLADPTAILRTGPLETEQLYSFLSACDLCWLPLTDSGANRGRWPLKLNDYMAVGRAVVGTDVGDLAEIILQESFGVVTPADPDIFARETLALLADNPRRETLGASARRAAETRFNWEILTDRLEKFYQQVLVAEGKGTA